MPEDNLPTEQETIKELQSQIERLEKEKSEYLDSLKRAKNDFVKYKQDESVRAEEIVLFSNRSLILMLLPVLDSFDFALKVAQGNSDLKRGFEMIRIQLDTALRSFGLESIIPKVGAEKANPEVHEVTEKKMCDTKGCSGSDEGLIFDVISCGYKLHGKLIRPAKVKVVTHN